MLITTFDNLNIVFINTSTFNIQYYIIYILYNFTILNYILYYNFIYYFINYFIISDFGMILVNSSYTYYIYNYFIYNYSFNYSIKFLASILILIFIRAGIPRYRYDFLTKLGWIKFFLYTFFFFAFNYFLFVLF